MLTLTPFRRANDTYRPLTLDRFFADPFFNWLEPAPLQATGWKPAVEVSETPSEIVFSVEVPGLEQKDLNIHVEEGLLTFSGEKTVQTEEGRDFVHRERVYGKFSRSFRLPETADAEKIQAGLANGVLTIRVPKREEAKPKKIEVQVS